MDRQTDKKERERERERESERQRERDRDRETERDRESTQTARQVNSQTYRQLGVKNNTSMSHQPQNIPVMLHKRGP